MVRPTSGQAHQSLCPSGRCTNGALLIGLVGEDGKVRYLGGPAQIDNDFVEVAQQGRTPESRFRFAEPCAQGSCENWAGDHCALVGRLQVEIPSDDESGPLPACGIRASCVWFHQEGKRACAICPYVVHTSFEPA